MANDDFPTLTPIERLAAEKDYAKDLFDTEFKAVGYLLTANGAGLIGCLSVIKDYNATPQLHGVGVFILLFAVGFLAGMVAFMLAQQHRHAIMRIFLGDNTKTNIKQLVWLSQIPQWVSGSALALAMLLIIHKFGTL
jgi:hypothetical protein